jgi:Protein of unknown function (DUF2530)
VSEQADPGSPEASRLPAAEIGQIPGRAGLRPAPPPLEADTFTLVLIGIVLWAVAFVALLPVRHEHRLWLEICAAGIGLGFIGLWLSRNRRFRHGRPR